MKRITAIVYFVLFGVAYAVASTTDYKSETETNKIYCENVKHNSRPDYKNNYEKVCNDD